MTLQPCFQPASLTPHPAPYRVIIKLDRIRKKQSSPSSPDLGTAVGTDEALDLLATQGSGLFQQEENVLFVSRRRGSNRAQVVDGGLPCPQQRVPDVDNLPVKDRVGTGRVVGEQIRHVHQQKSELAVCRKNNKSIKMAQFPWP